MKGGGRKEEKKKKNKKRRTTAKERGKRFDEEKEFPTSCFWFYATRVQQTNKK